MRLRRIFCQRNVPPWLILLTGVMLGGILTFTLTQRQWWCTYNDFSVDRETLSIIQVNERIRTHRNLLPLHPQVLQDPDCVCGEEAEKLRRITPCSGVTDASVDVQRNAVIQPTSRPSNSLVARPTEQTFVPPSVYENSEGFSGFIHPLATNLSSQNTPKQLQYLSGEYELRKKLLVAVLTSEKRLDRASMVYSTWGLDVSQILFFVGEDCNISQSEVARGLPIVRLPGIVDASEDSVAKTFAVLKYIHENYIDNFHWFMRAVDSVFIRGEKLERLIMRFDPSERIYLGRAANGREEDVERLRLLPHEYYCHGGAGVVVSQALLRELVPHLDYCLGAVQYHNREVKGGEEWNHADVELGRCVSRTVGVQCSLSAEVKAYFVHDYSKTTITEKTLSSSATFKHLITYHPVPDSIAMATLYHYYKRQDLQASLENVKYAESQIAEICHDLENGGVQALPPCEVSICPCEKGTDKRCPSAGVVTTAARSYQATFKYDYQSWEYFDSTTLYNDELMQPSYWLSMRKDRRHELQVVLGKMMQVASEQHGRYVRFRKVINGWVRHNPLRGNEYIIDAEFTEGRTGKIVGLRVSLVRPLAINYLPLPDNSDMQTPINFVVPITNVNDRFQEFMNMYENVFLKKRENVNLILSVYGPNDVTFVKEVLVSYREKYPEASITVLEGKELFSRGKALHLGMTKLHDEDLAFFCDIDMIVEEGFIDRCRKNTIRGKRVYYPEFFKLYNLDYVYRNGKSRPRRLTQKRVHGHWAYYSYGMLCIYKSDYLSVGGMNTNIVGWGEEDVNFFERVLKKRLDVLRAPDMGLSHRWHEKQCPSTLSEKQHRHCLSSRGENLADRIELANYIYELNMQIKYATENAEPVRRQLNSTI